MATDIEHLLLQDNGTLLTEGGTGLGKSYAYTVPALARIIELANTAGKSPEEFRIIIATAKKTLQAQLYADLPKLNEVLGVPNSVQVVLYKGLNNYACWKLESSVPEYERPAFRSFITRASQAHHPADIVDWPGARPAWWDTISLENCPLGVGCPHYRDCRPRVKDANIIITNQHLLGLDLSLFQPGWLFGPYNLLVVDEAHHLTKALRDLLSSRLRPETIAKTSKYLLNDPRIQSLILEVGGSKLTTTNFAKDIDSAYHSLIALIQQAANSSDSTHRYSAKDFLSSFESNHKMLDNILMSLIPIHDELSKSYEIVKSLGVYDDHDPDYYLAMMTRFNKITKPLIDAKTFLEKHIDPETVQQYITVAASTPDDSSLYMTPSDIGPIMGPILDQISHKVFVSATLSLNGDFSYFKDDLGLPKAEGKVYNSPFDIAKNVALYLPPFDMPQPVHGLAPGRLAWISKISEEIRNLCNLTKGGVFVLFSAEKDMSEVESFIGPALFADGLSLIVQRGEVTQHVNNFRQTPNGVLFGLKSVWEGIDIVGDQLRCVIIPKLPFPNPNDPVIASRSELATAQGYNAFTRVSLPAMFTDMRQGTGRLIRSATDKGIIAILDVRAWTGGSKEHDKRLKRIIADPDHKRLGYGKELLDILGFTTLTNDFTRLERWYNKTFAALNTVNTEKEREGNYGTSKGE
jgi:ATP-dependent DNA helicase DinG